MLFYNMFVAFVGLNDNTILAMRNIEFGSVSSDHYPDPAENASIEAIPILNIGSAYPYLMHLIGYCIHALNRCIRYYHDTCFFKNFDSTSIAIRYFCVVIFVFNSRPWEKVE